MSSDELIKGSCLCSQIQYEVTGPSQMRTMCHCKDCRKVSGSAFVTNSIYGKQQVRILTGADLLKTFDKATDSGNTLTRSSCSNCSSPLFIGSAAHPDAIVVSAGSMDSTTGDEWAPQFEYYPERRGKWLPEFPTEKSSF